MDSVTQNQMSVFQMKKMLEIKKKRKENIEEKTEKVKNGKLKTIKETRQQQYRKVKSGFLSNLVWSGSSLKKFKLS
jgi:hypothetical protein